MNLNAGRKLEVEGVSLSICQSGKSIFHTFFFLLEDIDLIFGLLFYHDKLQIKFKFCSGLMVLCRVMVLGLKKFTKIISFPHYFVILQDIDLNIGVLFYCDKLQIKIEFCSSLMILSSVMLLGL